MSEESESNLIEAPAQSEVAEAKEVPGTADGDPIAKYRDGNGNVLTEKIMEDLRATEERYNSLRRKLSEPTREKAVAPEDMADELRALDEGADRAFAENLIQLMGKSGLSKGKAEEFLNGLADIAAPEDAKTSYDREMKKLGEDGKAALAKVKSFHDTMRDSREFSQEETNALLQTTQTADGVRLIAKILEKAQTMNSGKFSNYRQEAESPGNMSQNEKINMYARAYAMERTDREGARAEIARLDKMFSK
jgi:hypothetical protein